jgi:YegS/Rv2252/BmrU family lipid kinase
MIHSDVRACLITNPKSGHGGIDLSEAITILQAHGWEVAVRQKMRGGGATDLARDAVRQGFNVVVDCGGDGTLNEIVEGVVGTGVAVGTIPGGTANLWAHEVGISPRPEVAALQLVGADQHRVDVGRVAVNGHHKRHFLLMAGLGLDGAILRQLSKPLKIRIGRLAYAPAVMRAVRSFHPAAVDADMDGVQWHGRATQVVVANTRRYGGFTQMCPHAYMDDGLLDICILTPDSALAVGRQVGSLLFRQQPSLDSTQEHRAAAVTIHSRVILPLEVDGGVIHLTNDELTADGVVYAFSLTAQGVSVLVPRTYNGDLFEPRRFSETLADIPLQPVVIPVPQQSETMNGHNGHHTIEGEKRKTWKMRIISIGVDSLTAAQVKNGHVVQVEVPSDTVLADANREDRTLWGELSTLTEGDLVEITGVKDAEQKVLRAQRVALAERTVPHKTRKQGHKH